MGLLLPLLIGGGAALALSSNSDDTPQVPPVQTPPPETPQQQAARLQYETMQRAAWARQQQEAQRRQQAAQRRQQPTQRNQPQFAPYVDQKQPLRPDSATTPQIIDSGLRVKNDRASGFVLDPSFLAQQGPITPQREVIQSSWLMRAINDFKITTLFKTKFPTAEAAIFSKSIDRKIIMLDTWESYRYFGQMLTSILFGLNSAQTLDYASNIAEWFRYHDWVIDPNGELKRGILAALAKHGGRFDRRLWPDGADGHGRPWAIMTPELLKDARKMPSISPTRAAQLIDEHDGLTLLLEYASARYMSLAMAQGIIQNDAFANNVAIGIVQGLTNAINGAIAAGRAIAVGQRSTESLGVVPIIVAAATIAAGVAQAMVSLGNEIEKWEAMPIIRKGIGDRIAAALDDHFSTSLIQRTISGFSGHKWKLVIPPNKPIDDVQDPLWRHFFFSTRGKINVGPQLPCYYLGIDFDMAWSIACLDHSIVTLHPFVDANKVPNKFAMVLIPQATLKGNSKALKMDVKYDPYEGLDSDYKPPACWPAGPEKGWMGDANDSELSGLSGVDDEWDEEWWDDCDDCDGDEDEWEDECEYLDEAWDTESYLPHRRAF